MSLESATFFRRTKLRTRTILSKYLKKLKQYRIFKNIELGYTHFEESLFRYYTMFTEKFTAFQSYLENSLSLLSLFAVLLMITALVVIALWTLSS